MIKRKINIIVCSNSLENLNILESIQTIQNSKGRFPFFIDLYLCLNNMYEERKVTYTEEEEVQVPHTTVIGSYPVYVTDKNGNIVTEKASDWTEENQHYEPKIDHYEPITTTEYTTETQTVTKTKTERVHIDYTIPQEVEDAFDYITEVTEPLSTMSDIRLYCMQSMETPLDTEDFIWFIDADDELDINGTYIKKYDEHGQPVYAPKIEKVFLPFFNRMRESQEKNCYYYGVMKQIKGDVESEIVSCTDEVSDPFNAICVNEDISNYFVEWIFKVGLCKSYLYESPKVSIFDETPVIMQFMQNRDLSSRKWMDLEEPFYVYIRNDDSMSSWDKPWEYYSKPIVEIAEWMLGYYRHMQYYNQFIFKFMKSRLDYVLRHFDDATTKVNIVNSTETICDKIPSVESGRSFFASLTAELLS